MYALFNQIPKQKKSSEWVLSRILCKNVVTFFRGKFKNKYKKRVDTLSGGDGSEHWVLNVTPIHALRLSTFIVFLLVGKGGDDLLSSHIEIGSEWFSVPNWCRKDACNNKQYEFCMQLVWVWAVNTFLLRFAISVEKVVYTLWPNLWIERI